MMVCVLAGIQLIRNYIFNIIINYLFVLGVTVKIYSKSGRQIELLHHISNKMVASVLDIELWYLFLKIIKWIQLIE